MRSFTLFLGQCVQLEKPDIFCCIYALTVTGNWIWYGDFDYCWDSVCSGRNQIYSLAYAPTVTGLVLMRSLTLFFGQCVQREKSDISRCICSNRDRQLDFIRRFRLFLGQCVQHCSGRNQTYSVAYAPTVTGSVLMRSFRLFLGTVCTAGETRHIQLHMLQPCQAIGFDTEISIIFGTVYAALQRERNKSDSAKCTLYTIMKTV